MKLRFLFWNTNRKNVNDAVTELALAKSPDLIFLAEYSQNPADLLVKLNSPSSKYHYIRGIANFKLHLFSVIPPNFIDLIHEERDLSAWMLNLPNILRLNICGIHGRSKMSSKPEEQFQDSIYYSQAIQRFEESHKNDSTILFGDFNQNPYEAGLVSLMGYNAVMEERIAHKCRTHHKKKMPFFYNPSWSLFGDLSPGPPGSYYYSNSGSLEQYWHIFDQLLMRPSLVPHFCKKTFHLISSVSNHTLSKPDGTPNNLVYSDHFPLFFEFEF